MYPIRRIDRHICLPSRHNLSTAVPDWPVLFFRRESSTNALASRAKRVYTKQKWGQMDTPKQIHIYLHRPHRGQFPCFAPGSGSAATFGRERGVRLMAGSHARSQASPVGPRRTRTDPLPAPHHHARRKPPCFPGCGRASTRLNLPISLQLLIPQETGDTQCSAKDPSR